MNDSLGDRMKSYERVTRAVVMPHSYTIIRVDGRAFHTYLRDAEKPFDLNFQNAMMNVGAQLAEQISGVRYVYGQSDEISLLLDDTAPQAQPWFGGVLQKMASVAASLATVALISQRGWDRLPHFDARVFTVPSLGEAENYFIWRQLDALRNSISMAAQARFSHQELYGKHSDQMQDMLWKIGINWNDYPDACKRGWVVERESRETTVTYHHKRTNEEVSTPVVRNLWMAKAAPNFVFGFLHTQE